MTKDKATQKAERIIVVDDDPQVTGFLSRYLTKEGFEVASAASGRELSYILESQTFDLCVLDMILPDRDGFEITKELTGISSMPIIVLTARTDMVDRVVGLELGADDYLTKPFEPRELLARIKAVLRRTRSKDKSSAAPEQTRARLHFSGWCLDIERRTLRRQASGELVSLTAMEFALVKSLADHAGKVLSRELLLDLVHGSGLHVADRAIDVHVARVRRKIERDPENPDLIKTVRGQGYVLAADVMTDLAQSNEQ